jgi:hypothetical protein
MRLSREAREAIKRGKQLSFSLLSLMVPGISHQQLYYYRHEAQYHIESYGGLRTNNKWTEETKKDIERMLFNLVNKQPDITMSEIIREFLEHNISLSPRTISRIFHKWKWSAKTPIYKQLAKYSRANTDRYIDYLQWVISIPITEWERIKFIDESSFAPRRRKCKFVIFSKL